MKQEFKPAHFIMVLLCALLCCLSSCSNDEPEYESPYGSIRDNVYKGDKLKVYVDDQLQSSVTQVLLTSQPIGPIDATTTDPKFNTTMHFKGLMGNKKVTDVHVISTIDYFQGTTVIKGKEYEVNGYFIGHPFQTQLSDMGIVVYFKSK